MSLFLEKRFPAASAAPRACVDVIGGRKAPVLSYVGTVNWHS